MTKTEEYMPISFSNTSILVKCWTSILEEVMFVKGFDVIGSHRAILNQLFQETCDEIGNRLLALFTTDAIDARYRNVGTYTDCPDIGNHD